MTVFLKLWKIADRINLNIIDLNGKFELDVYKKQLQKIKEYYCYGWYIIIHLTKS